MEKKQSMSRGAIGYYRLSTGAFDHGTTNNSAETDNKKDPAREKPWSFQFPHNLILWLLSLPRHILYRFVRGRIYFPVEVLNGKLCFSLFRGHNP